MRPEQSGNLYVVAVIAGQRIAIDAAGVAAVVDLPPVMPAPLAPPHILGLCALRSRILTVVDLALALGQPSDRASRRAITMDIDGHYYAFVVASVEEVEPSTEKTHPVDSSVGHAWVSAACGRIETESGTALLLEPHRLVRSCAEMA